MTAEKAFNGIADSFSHLNIVEKPPDQSETLNGATGNGNNYNSVSEILFHQENSEN